MRFQGLIPQGYKADGSRYYRCPVCHGNKKLEVSATGRLWFCHKCGEGGRCDLQPKQQQPEREMKEWKLRPMDPSAWGATYLKRRGLGDFWEELCPHSGPSPLRVYLPIYEGRGTAPASWTARAICEGAEPKYLNPPLQLCRKRKSHLLWGLHRLSHPLDRVVLVEGIFDAVWSQDRLALLGKTISPIQIQLLKRWVLDEITVMLDGDAHYAAAKVADTLVRNWKGKVSIIHLPAGMDPDTLGAAGNKWVQKRERVG